MTDRSRIWRPHISSVTATLAVAAYILAATNLTFWTKGATYFAGHGYAFAAFAAGLFALHVAVITMVSVKFVLKPLLIALVVVAALAAYFTDAFGVIINHDMIKNAAVTTTSEAKHLITPRFIGHFLLFGVLPAGLLLWARIEHKPLRVKAVEHSRIIAIALAVAGAVTYANFLTYAQVLRQHRDFIATLNPVAPLSAAVKYVRRTSFSDPVVVAAIGTDAVDTDAIEVANHKEAPHVLVVVAGETARAQSFSLFGYGRDTNPRLSKIENVVAFSNTTSCGTATAISLPCMFSVYKREEYSDTKGESTESVLDVLTHAGIHTEWWDANTGSKGVAARTVEINLAAGEDPRFCIEGECRDTILVDKLKAALAKVDTNTVFVMHMIGSHGPAYYMRYEAETAPFKPDCRTGEFASCTHEEIVNAYDNTIAYTDKVLADIIDVLATEGSGLNAAMIYMSDHGESLGENGLYLHGAPWFMAPAEQTHVPFISWLSPRFVSEEAFDMACLRSQAGAPYSHDNLFHTILGAMEVRTGVYDAALDVFAPCRSADLEAHASASAAR